MVNLTLEKSGTKINIFGRDEYNTLMKKDYYYYSINEAIKDFKAFFGLKYQRNVHIKKVKKCKR